MKPPLDNTSSQTGQQVLDDVVNSHPDFRSAFDVMKGSAHTHTITFEDSANSTNGHFGRDAANISTDGVGAGTFTLVDIGGETDDRQYSAQEVLAHEFFGHALDKDRGIYDTGTQQSNGLANSEASAVRAQNLYTESQGGAPRTTYSGDTVENPSAANSNVTRVAEQHRAETFLNVTSALDSAILNAALNSVTVPLP